MNFCIFPFQGPLFNFNPLPEHSQNATLVLKNAKVDGNVISKQASQIQISDSRIDGNIEAKTYTPSFSVKNTTVDGNIVCDQGSRLQGGNNRVDGYIECPR